MNNGHKVQVLTTINIDISHVVSGYSEYTSKHKIQIQECILETVMVTHPVTSIDAVEI